MLRLLMDNPFLKVSPFNMSQGIICSKARQMLIGTKSTRRDVKLNPFHIQLLKGRSVETQCPRRTFHALFPLTARTIHFAQRVVPCLL